MRGQGLLLVGPKGSGKTTISLALAARGHDFLGDEMAGVRIGSLELVPVRRSLAVRDGWGQGSAGADG
jgi:serine kinase of HPr protein (carbohydrate metabolism regulator)